MGVYSKTLLEFYIAGRGNFLSFDVVLSMIFWVEGGVHALEFGVSRLRVFDHDLKIVDLCLKILNDILFFRVVTRLSREFLIPKFIKFKL